MDKESKYKGHCDDYKRYKHAELQLPAPLVLGHVELDKDDPVDDQGDEDQAYHGQTPGFKSCQTFKTSERSKLERQPM